MGLIALVLNKNLIAQTSKAQTPLLILGDNTSEVRLKNDKMKFKGKAKGNELSSLLFLK